jgi:probable HAF family extracellular repeat protein
MDTVGGMVDLGTLGASYSSPVAVNDSGQVIGLSSTLTATHAFSWTHSGGMVDLGTLGGRFSSPVALNDNGQVIGQSDTGGNADPNVCPPLYSPCPHGFSWTQSGGMVDLTLGGSYSVAFALSDSGQVVGQSNTAGDPGCCPHAFSWTQSGGIVDLGTLGGRESKAWAVSDSGQVVGVSTIARDAEFRATLWLTVSTVSIDIKPGGHPNSINPKSRGRIPVAILATDTFDPTTVDPNTIAFGPKGARPLHSTREDVDGDGDIDVIFYFSTQATGIQCGDTSVSLTGEARDGTIEGSDSVITVGC